MEDEVPDLSAVVREEFGFRRRQKPVTNGAVDAVPFELVDRAGDTDYAPKVRSGVKRKRVYKPRKKNVDVVDAVSDDEPPPSSDLQAYFENTMPRVDEDGNDLYCICRRGDLGKWMVGCDGCDEWYHGDCVNVSKTDEELIDQFFCPRCERNGEGSTLWKRKCRLQNCRKPAQEPSEHTKDEDGDVEMTDSPPRTTKRSKYCSREHGIEYFKDKIAQALITKSEIKSMVEMSQDVLEFQTLGEATPVVTGVVTDADRARLEAMDIERDTIQTSLKKVKARCLCLNSMYERSARINAGLRARKEKEICGLDERLNLQAQDLDALLQSSGFLDSLLNSTTDNLCTVTAKKCTRHAGWFEVKMDGNNLEEELLVSDLNKLRQEDHELRMAAQRRMEAT